jgi:hypothetical protein
MVRSPSLFSTLCGAVLGVLLSAASAQGETYVETHSSGRMAMSADGSNIAFVALGMPTSEFVLLNVPTQRAIIIRGPLSHIGDLGWSADGDELTFVTAENHTLGGGGRHVWRLRPGASPSIDLLAIIPHVRSPVLSSDGRRLGAFEGVMIGDEPSRSSNVAFAIFERSIEDGTATRRSEGHDRSGGTLFYDRAGALYTRLNGPVFPHRTVIRDHVLYDWQNRDDEGRWDTQWFNEVRAFSFRILPGELLPAWPTAFPAEARGNLVRPLDDGRVVLFGSANPHRTTEWYDERGRPRQPTRRAQFDYVAYAADGSAEMLVADALPDGAGRTGGHDVSADGRYFAQIVSRTDRDNILMLYENGTLRSETRVADIATGASRLSIEPSETPIMPAVTEVHRIPAPN